MLRAPGPAAGLAPADAPEPLEGSCALEAGLYSMAGSSSMGPLWRSSERLEQLVLEALLGLCGLWSTVLTGHRAAFI